MFCCDCAVPAFSTMMEESHWADRPFHSFLRWDMPGRLSPVKAWLAVGQRTRADIVKAKNRADLSFLLRRMRFFGLTDSSVCMMVGDCDCWTWHNGFDEGNRSWITRVGVVEEISHIFLLFAMKVACVRCGVDDLQAVDTSCLVI